MTFMGRSDMKWSLLDTAPDQISAEIWCDILRQEGIAAMIEPRDTASYLGVSAFPCRIMVAADMLSEAREALREYLGSQDPEN